MLVSSIAALFARSPKWELPQCASAAKTDFGVFSRSSTVRMKEGAGAAVWGQLTRKATQGSTEAKLTCGVRSQGEGPSLWAM